MLPIWPPQEGTRAEVAPRITSVVREGRPWFRPPGSSDWQEIAGGIVTYLSGILRKEGFFKYVEDWPVVVRKR